jgi:photosystem II stability/assembly factor-like uncharacterized protein
MSMSKHPTPTLLVGTRKGLFVLRNTGKAWVLQSTHFLGEPVSYALATPQGWFAALRLGHFGVKLHRSSDAGQTWQEVAAPAFPTKPTEGPFKDDPTPWTVDMVWHLAHSRAQNGERETLWAGCIPAGLFKSQDAGASWQLVEALWQVPRRTEWFGGGYDQAGIHSILIDPRDARHITVGISCAGVWQSRDAGATWQATCNGLDANYLPPERREDPVGQDPHCIAQCEAQPDVLWMQHHGGLYRSADAGHTWQRLPTPQPSDFGFAIAAHPTDSARAWVVPAQADAQRIPVGARMVVGETRDSGQSFITHNQGLPEFASYHLVYRHGMAITPNGESLAMGSTTGGLWTSNSEGKSWVRVALDLPPIASVCFA